MTSYVTKKSQGDTAWFQCSRFGMFIHFGLYALPARHEWVKHREKTPEEQYQKYFDYFNPDLCDPREWAKRAKAAGMKYAVLTAKHHEGFCLFDTKYTDYNVMNTPYGKDIVKEYADAFRAEGLRVGLYYSLIDWHHPDFPIDVTHPRRDDADAKELDRGRDMKKYARYMRDQVTELLTNYGKIDILWFDFSYPGYEGDNHKYDWMQFGGGKGKDQWESEKLIATARSLQPGLIIDNRCGIEQDLWTPEQIHMTEWPKHPETGELVTWEVCHTFSGSWGYHRDEATWKSPEVLIDLLIDTVSMGGNLLMNVGPTGRGTFDRRAEDALAVYEKWMKYNSRAIYGCTKAEPEFEAPEGTKLTQSMDSKRLYIHLRKYPYGIMGVKNLKGRIAYAQFLHDASEIQYTEGRFNHFSMEGQSAFDDQTVYFNIPDIRPDVAVPVIEVFLKDASEQ